MSDNLAISLLSRAHSPTSTSRIYSEKVQHRPLLLRSSEPAPDARQQRRDKRAAQIKKRKALKPRPLSSRQRRKLGIYSIKTGDRDAKYEIFEPLNRLWLGYMREVLSLDGEGKVLRKRDALGMAPLLCSADYHGAKMTVVRSKCAGRVGISGIVTRDTKFTFVLITEKNEIKRVPKEGTIFKLEIPVRDESERPSVEDGSTAPPTSKNATNEALVFELHGEQFQYRAVDRANKKFKPHFLPDL